MPIKVAQRLRFVQCWTSLFVVSCREQLSRIACLGCAPGGKPPYTIESLFKPQGAILVHAGEPSVSEHPTQGSLQISGLGHDVLSPQVRLVHGQVRPCRGVPDDRALARTDADRSGHGVRFSGAFAGQGLPSYVVRYTK